MSTTQTSYQRLKDITLNVTSNVIKKIIACNIATGKKSEWIGILFYKKIDDKTLETVDICYMGKGPENSMVANIDYNEFPELASVLSNYVMNNVDNITNCYQGLIHSHIDMGTSPSGTDISELQVNNPNYNGTYLSVICNHSLEFTSLISVEEQQPTRAHNYKWFGKVISKEVEAISNINVYTINTKVDMEVYDDIHQALEVIKKTNLVKSIAKPPTLFSGFGTQASFEEYIEDLNEYFEFANESYIKKISILNNYAKDGYSIDEFINAVGEPFSANELLKQLKRYSHTAFYKDLTTYIDIFKLGYDEL